MPNYIENFAKEKKNERDANNKWQSNGFQSFPLRTNHNEMNLKKENKNKPNLDVIRTILFLFFVVKPNTVPYVSIFLVQS